MFNGISKEKKKINPKIFVFGPNMSGKTYRALGMGEPEKTYLISLDGKAEYSAHLVNTVNVTTFDDLVSVFKEIEKLPEDAVIIFDVISRIADIVKAKTSEFYKVDDFTITKSGWDPRKGWGYYGSLYSKILDGFKGIKQTLIVTDHQADDIEHDSSGRIIKKGVISMLQAERPGKPIQFTKLMDVMDVCLRTYTQSGKYLVSVVDKRGDIEIPKAFK